MAVRAALAEGQDWAEVAARAAEELGDAADPANFGFGWLQHCVEDVGVEQQLVEEGDGEEEEEEEGVVDPAMGLMGFRRAERRRQLGWEFGQEDMRRIRQGDFEGVGPDTQAMLEAGRRLWGGRRR